MENNQTELKQNNRKTSLMIIGLAILVIGLVGVTYAFFNYTRTGSANTIRVGKMAFSSNQTETINLTNVFPISRTDALTDTTNTDEAIITITGDTTYERGIEYLVTVTDVSNTIGTGTNVKTVPISVIVGASNGLGTSDDDYFENRGNTTSLYKLLSDETITNNGRLIVGYIAPGSTGINGTVTIKAYIDSSLIAISDTYNMEETDENGTTTNWVNGRAVLTTSEWNSLQTNGVSFKVKVEANEGTWVKDVVTLYSAIILNNNSGESGGSGSGQSGSSSSPSLSSIPLDSENSTYVQNVSSNTLTNAKAQFLGANSGEHRVMKLSSGIDFSQASSETNGKGLYMRAGTQDDPYPIIYYRGNVTNNNVAFAGFCWQIVRTTETGGIKMIYNGAQDENGTCLPLTSETSGEGSSEASGEVNNNKRLYFQTLIGVDGKYYFPFDGDFANDVHFINGVGYMHGTPYVAKGSAWGKNVYFGTGFIYEDGVYKLTNAAKIVDATHHYSCNSTDPNETCSEIMYVFKCTGSFGSNCSGSWGNSNSLDYIILTDGDGVEQALEKMQLNTTSSYAKTIIDAWYATNMTNYTSYLEDTVWCNDRSVYSYGGWSSTGELNLLYYSGWNRNTNTYTPSYACSQINDRFTVSNSNGNGALTYPVGLLTADEELFAGAIYDYYNPSTTRSYLWNGKQNWTMTPCYIGWPSANIVTTTMEALTDSYLSNERGLRPAVSLKLGTAILDNGADGTLAHPYIVE